MINNITITILLILLAFWNGKVITWYLARMQGKIELAKKYSKQWHRLGLYWRIVLAIYFIGYQNYDLIISLFTDFQWCNLIDLAANTAWFFNLAYTGYDIIINLCMKILNPEHSVFYIDYKGFNKWIIDKLTKKGIWVFRLILILTNILIIFL